MGPYSKPWTWWPGRELAPDLSGIPSLEDLRRQRAAAVIRVRARRRVRRVLGTNLVELARAATELEFRRSQTTHGGIP